jgi:hypothetical protein
MFRLIHPADQQELPFRMLFHPEGEGIFLRACEADSFRGLVAALLDDAGYEHLEPEARLELRLRLADDVRLLGQMAGGVFEVADRDGPETINVASDRPFIRSLERIAFVSLSHGSPI